MSAEKTAMVLASPHDYTRQMNIAAMLRENFRTALAAASPALGEELKTKVKNAPHPAKYLLEESK